jgi:hypothetical protein|tara:strand:+ start:997 stop:1710 length:714 start_codon:yes stop_codon:yes gene_type:complete
MVDSNIHSITFTNKGYIDYTHNLLTSIRKNSTNTKLEIIAIDDESYQYFKPIHKDVSFYETKFVSKRDELLKQNEDGFGNLMMTKFEVIFDALQKHEKVLYIDGDIVIKKDFNNYLEQVSYRKDIVFQNDKRPSKPNEIKVCAGFMLITSNAKTLKFFNPDNVPFKKIIKYVAHDQTHINKSRNKFKHTLLPLDTFPNGPHYYSKNELLDPYIIHFNFLIGDVKKEKMKEFGEWYLN